MTCQHPDVYVCNECGGAFLCEDCGKVVEYIHGRPDYERVVARNRELEARLQAVREVVG